MPKVAIEQLQEGMVLAEDIHNASGQLVVPRGLPLRSIHIRAVHRLGLEEVNVDDASASRVTNAHPLSLLSSHEAKVIEEELEQHFGGIQNANDLGKAIFKICLERKAKQKIEGDNE